MLAQLGALGHEAQAVEVHVGAARRSPPACGPWRGARSIQRLAPASAERARGLHHGARVLEDVLDRRADLVGVDQHHLVDELARQAEGLLAHLAHRHAVGEEVHVRQRHAPAGLERGVHRVRVHGLHADDPRARRDALHVGGDAGDQPAAAHRDEDRVDGLRVLAQDLHADGALARDHQRIVVGVHEGEAVLARERPRVHVGLVVAVAVQLDLGAARRHRRDLDARRGDRHHDRGRARRASARRAPRPARGCRRWRRSRRARASAVERCAILLYAPRSLKEKTGCLSSRLSSTWLPSAPRDRGRGIERALDRHVVDARGEDLLQVVVLHQPARIARTRPVILPVPWTRTRSRSRSARPRSSTCATT